MRWVNIDMFVSGTSSGLLMKFLNSESKIWCLSSRRNQRVVFA